MFATPWYEENVVLTPGDMGGRMNNKLKPEEMFVVIPARWAGNLVKLLGGSIDVKRWAQTTELAGYRVGLLLCDDLVVAAHMISQESAIFGSTLTPKDRVKELVRYSVSEDYFKARYNIGLQVS